MNSVTKAGAPFASAIDETVETAFPANASLIIFAGSKELTVAISDKDRNKFIYLKSFHYSNHSELEEIIPSVESFLAKEKIAGNKFRNVSCVVDTTIFTLLPDSLYESFRRDEYLQFNHEVPKGDVTEGYSLRSKGIVILFSYPGVLRQVIARKFPSVKMIPSVAGIIEAGSLLFHNKSGKNILVNVKQQAFDLLVIEENKVHFINTFPYKSSEDFLYYLLFTCEQLKLNTETMELHLAGEIDKRSGLAKLMEKYIRNIYYVKAPSNFEYSYKFNDIPSHFFFNVFSQQLCV